MKHRHHIIPRHMGGSDDSSNLIELSVEEHAEAHRKLFEEHGYWQDYLAWQGLAGLIPKQELVRLIQSEAAKAVIEKYGNPWSGVRTWGNFAINEEFRKIVAALSNTPEAIEKKKKTMALNKHQQGIKNSQYGCKWCVKEDALDLKERIKFKDIPSGYITTTEWRNKRKITTNSAFGKHWYNDGVKNYLLKDSDPLVTSLIKGRIMVVN